MTNQRNLDPILRLAWIVASISLYIGLIFPYVGEEGVYTASSFEMLFNHHFTDVYFMGGYFGRPPLYNWLILGVAHYIGYPHMLIAARFVTITLTTGTSLILYWFTQTISQNRTLALFSVLGFLSGDLLFRSSWIAYADPTFSFFTVTAICLMWIGYVRQQQRWLFIAIPALIAAFLAKTLTCYVFYGITALVLLFQYRAWRYFFHPISILLHLIVLASPLIWFSQFSEHHGGRMIWDLLHNYQSNSFSFVHAIKEFLTKTLIYFLRFAPLSLIAVYCLFSSKKTSHPTWIKTILLCTLINFLPYWLTPGVYQTRYLLPLFPFISILMAYTIYNSKETLFHFSIAVLLFFIGMKLFLSPWGLPWFEHMSYAYTPAAQEIMQDTQKFPLYTNNNDSIIATLDALRYPNPPIVQPSTAPGNLYVVGNPATPQDHLMKYYVITNMHFGLYCRGLACPQ